MRIGPNRRRALLSWLFVGALFALCGVLGFLQYRWLGEVSVAARERLRGGLQASLSRISQDFNSEISAECRALLPSRSASDIAAVEAQLAARSEQFRSSSRHRQLFSQVALAEPQGGHLTLRRLDLETGALATAVWPVAWSALQDRLEGNLARGAGRGGPNSSGPARPGEGFALEVPLFAPSLPGAFSDGERPGQPRREIAWLIFEVNPQYVRDTLLPELLQRHLGNGGTLEYQVEVVTRTAPAAIIYQSDPSHSPDLTATADASISLFEPQSNLMRDRGPGRGKGPGPRMPRPAAAQFGRGPGPPAGGGPPEPGRWLLFVRHRAGSLEAVVGQARRRNLGVTAGVLLLILVTAAALIRFSRKAEKLAGLQMEFVAGVSHELRTPLTVIHTAAYNLQGRMSGNPSQVQAHAALIQQESGRLKDLVEQVLQFASANAGRVIHEPEPVSVEAVIEESMESSRPLLQGSKCTIDRSVEPELPAIMGDAMALRHAIQNLISNAVKYGSKGGNWIGISASRTRGQEPAAVEIRVADRGPGIPQDEQPHIFDPFFRGAQAVQDQVHGTGLGLNLVKKIVEAHGGSIRVESSPMRTEFIMRFPAAPELAG